MTSKPQSSYDWHAFRQAWLAIVPFAALALLGSAGGTLSLLFRIRPPATGIGASAALLYALAVVPVPLLISLLVLGYSWTRLTLTAFLWVHFALLLVNFPALFDVKPKAAFGLLPFLGASMIALRLGHGSKLRVALGRLAENRRLRWGPGLGWALVATGCTLFATGSASILVAAKLEADAGAAWLRLASVPRLIPAMIGILAASALISRMPQSRKPLLWLIGVDLTLLGFVFLADGVKQQTGAYALTAMICAGLALVALFRPALDEFRARQRAKSRDF